MIENHTTCSVCDGSSQAHMEPEQADHSLVQQATLLHPPKYKHNHHHAQMFKQMYCCKPTIVSVTN